VIQRNVVNSSIEPSRRMGHQSSVWLCFSYGRQFANRRRTMEKLQAVVDIVSEVWDKAMETTHV